MLFHTLGAFALAATATLSPTDPVAPSERPQVERGVLIPAIPSLSFDRTVAMSHAAVSGYVLDRRVVDDARLPHTEYTIGVLDRAHGDTPDVIHVLVPGSETATPPITVMGAPTFAPADEVVLFLLASEAGPTSFHVAGLSQGVYRVQRGPDDDGVARVAGQHALPSESTAEFLSRVAAKRAQIIETRGPDAVLRR